MRAYVTLDRFVARDPLNCYKKGGVQGEMLEDFGMNVWREHILQKAAACRLTVRSNKDVVCGMAGKGDGLRYGQEFCRS